jgi:hypothetical protein
MKKHKLPKLVSQVHVFPSTIKRGHMLTHWYVIWYCHGIMKNVDCPKDF